MKYRPTVALASLAICVFVGTGPVHARGKAFVAPAVARILAAYEESGQSPERVLDVIVRARSRPIDRALVRALASGTLDLVRLRRQEAADNARDIEAFVADYRATPRGFTLGEGTVSFTRLWIANSLAMRGPVDLIARLARRPDVEGIYVNRVVKVIPVAEASVGHDIEDPFVNRRRGRPPAPRARPPDTRTTWGIRKIGADTVWRMGITGKDVVVGHIDTGVDPTHPTLRGKVLAFRDFTGGKDRAYDDNGHGTHTAGTITGTSPRIGVAPGSRLVVAKAMNSQGGGDLKAILAAMQWMLDPAPARRPAVCSNSWGVDRGDLGDEAVLFWDAVQSWKDGGILPVFASGNSGPDTETVPGGYPHALAVGATDAADGAASFSSGGRTQWNSVTLVKPDLAAPGVGIVSASPGGKLAKLSGTSMACPHVAGVAALVKQANPRLSPDAIHKILVRTSRDLGAPGRDTRFGAGLLDAVRAVREARSQGLTLTVAQVAP